MALNEIPERLMHLLAQIPTPEPSQLITFILCALACLAGANQIVKLWRSFQPQPPLAERYPSKEAHDALEARMEEFRMELDRHKEEASERSKDIYEILRRNAEQLSALTTITEEHSRRIIHTEARIDNHLTK